MLINRNHLMVVSVKDNCFFSFDCNHCELTYTYSHHHEINFKLGSVHTYNKIFSVMGTSNHMYKEASNF